MPQRPAYTLFELILVLTLLVIVAGISYPVVETWLIPNRLESASDLLQGKWAEMRAKALEEGRAYCCEFDPQGKTLRIRPDDSPADEAEETPLPINIQFGGETPVSMVYLPDGTAQDDVEVRLEHAGFRAIVLKLRALTGVVTRARPGDLP